MEKLLQKEAPEESGAVRNENQRSSRMRRDFFIHATSAENYLIVQKTVKSLWRNLEWKVYEYLYCL